MLDHAAKMLDLGAEPMRSRVDPTPDMLVAFEERFRIALPDDYRRFLAKNGAMQVRGSVSFQEPTPLGEGTGINQFFGFVADSSTGDLAWATDIAEGHGICVPIGESGFGDWFYLMCSGKHRGHVLFDDHEQRHLWRDEEFVERFSHLSTSIQRYLAMRRARELPPPLSETPGWYLVGSSFDEFLGRRGRMNWSE